MKTKIEIGGTLEDAGKRVIDAWHRAERGEKVEPTDTITFVSWKALHNVMTDKRHALLRHLRKRPASSVRALAKSLKRDYKNVHEDVKALSSIGLINTKGRTLRVEYSKIETAIPF